MAWLALIGAGCCEIVGVMGIKRITVRKDLTSVLLLLLSFSISFSLLSFAMREIPMGTAYAIWTGIGTVGAACMGMFLYGEPREWRRLLFIAMILGSAVGLKLLG